MSGFARAWRAEPWWLSGLDWRLVGWVALLAMVFTAAISAGWINPEHEGWRDNAAKVLVVLLLNMLAGLAILLITTLLSNLLRPRLPLPWILGIAVIVGPLLGHVIMAAQRFDDRPPEFSSPSGTALFVAIRSLLIALPWAVAAAAWYFHRRAALRTASLRSAELDRGRLETGMMEAQLRALEAQVEPHFLFNTLAHVRRLYRTDPACARQMLERFRVYLDAALPKMREGSATLGREVELVRAYLDVQQVRMGPRLRVRIEVPDALRAQPFPSMMLISLVENAIKHGLNVLPQGGEVAILATRSERALRVSVADTGRGIGDQLGTGVGLANIRDRLAARFGPQGRLALVPRSPQGVLATIEVPLDDDGVNELEPATPAAAVAA